MQPNRERKSYEHLDPDRYAHLIRRYCTCGWAFNKNADGTVDEGSRVLTFNNPDCKLHSPDARFDLPPEFP